MAGAAVSAISAAWLLVAVAFPNGGATRHVPILAASEERAIASTAKASSAAGRDLARADTMQSLRLSPYNSWAWCRLAYIDAQRNGAVGPDGLHALEMSYKAAPLGPAVTRWRLVFLFNHWGDLTPELRLQAQRELRARGPLTRDLVKLLLDHVDDPSGSLALTLMLARMPKPAQLAP